MNITVSQIPYTTDYDVWINSTKLLMTRGEILALNNALTDVLRSSE